MRLRPLLAVLAATVLLAGCSDASEPEGEDADPPSDSSESATADAVPVAEPVQFRVVEFSDANPPPAGPAGGGGLARFERLDCDTDPVPSVPTPATEPVVACAPPQEDPGEGAATPAMKYALGPAEIVGGVADAEASVPDGQLDWVVDVQLDADAADTFARVCERLVGTGQQFAIVFDGVVVSAPTVQGVITDGRVQISGGFTAETAELLADQLAAAPA